MKRASKKPREWWAVISSCGEYVWDVFPTRERAIFAKRVAWSPECKVIKVREVVKPRRGKK